MRTLKFNIRAQVIEKDPACDFKGLVAGSEGYLQAAFTTDAAWKGCAIAASFWHNGQEHAAPVKNGVCMIPPQALTGRVVGVSLTGRRASYRISTGRVYFRQEVSE